MGRENVHDVHNVHDLRPAHAPDTSSPSGDRVMADHRFDASHAKDSGPFGRPTSAAESACVAEGNSMISAQNCDSSGDVQANGQGIAPARAAVRIGILAETDAPSPPQSDWDGASDRDRRGRFMRGNRASVRHSLHTENVPELARIAREQFLWQARADEADDPPTRRASLIEYRSVLHGQIALVANALERFGIFDRRGKLRALWLTKLESLIGAAVSIDRLLGLDRRQKDALDLSPAEWLERLSPSPSSPDLAAGAPAETDHAGAPEMENADE